MNTLDAYLSFFHKSYLSYVRKLQPENVLILDPDVQQISDVYRVSPDTTITIRVWELDDGRTEQNPEGVYKELRSYPEVLGETHAQMFTGIIKNFEYRARERGIPFPDREQLFVHLVNEPDSNNLMYQINRYTVSAVNRLNRESIPVEVFNFGTGHPSILNSNGKPDWSPLKESIDLITGTNNVASLHEYYNDLGLNDESLNPWHVFRHKWAPRGPKYRIGEFGLDMLLNQRMNGHHGWQNVISEQQYLDNIYDYIANVRNDVIGVRIFMTGFADRTWKSFNTEPIHDRLSQIYFESEFVEGPVTPPDSSDFERAVAKVLSFEGGYSVDPNDPGNWTGGKTGQGELKGTKYGISSASYPSLDIKNLTVGQAKDIYYTDFWVKSGANELRWPLSLVHFDTAVNTGPGQAKRFLDASMGEWVRYMAERTIWYTQIQNWEHYGKAWTRRNGKLMLEALG